MQRTVIFHSASFTFYTHCQMQPRVNTRAQATKKAKCAKRMREYRVRIRVAARIDRAVTHRVSSVLGMRLRLDTLQVEVLWVSRVNPEDSKPIVLWVNVERDLESKEQLDVLSLISLSPVLQGQFNRQSRIQQAVEEMRN